MIQHSFEDYRKKMRRIADVMFSSAVMQWDQETYMPEKGSDMRAQQLSTLAGIAHELSVDNELGVLLEKLSKDPSLDFRSIRNIRQSSRDYNDRKKYSTAFVEELSLAVSNAFVSWQEAKNKNDFKLFSPNLEKLVELKKKEADILGYDEHPYDALIDQFEPGTKASEIERIFEKIKTDLKELILEIRKKEQSRDDFMFRTYPSSSQWDFGIYLLGQMGYDFKAGRQDVSSHPFTIHFNANDVRVTTRIDENNLHEMIWSTIHEGGHALYEQGLRPEDYGLPTGEACSLAIHESQSRLWENNIGRGLPYWECNFKKLNEFFPDQLKDVSLPEFYKAMNQVKPSLIRTNADELTYHFHVLIRFEIEKELIAGNVKVKDLPGLWNEKYKTYLGLDVPSDAEGVLQDIHWSHGSFGYFPTYSLGSFYAAQFYAAAKKEIRDLEAMITSGNLRPLLEWLRTKIHDHGKLYNAAELVEVVTGEKPDFKYFMKYAREKYTGIYDL